MFGRRTIYTNQTEITRRNLVEVVSDALQIHNLNKIEINYLLAYRNGKQPILDRTVKVREDINNKIVENHASEAVAFYSGYFMGDPYTYVRRGDDESKSSEIEKLNEYMFAANKASCDKELATWFFTGGNAYRMCLANPNRDGAPFEIGVCDPRNTFIVYRNDFTKPRMLGAREIVLPDDSVRYVGYTKTHYFECDTEKVYKWQPHTYIDIPIFEYSANVAQQGVFEPGIEILNAINNVQSNRVDAVEKFVASLLIFYNCDIDDDAAKSLREAGLIKLKSSGDIKADVKEINEALDQTQTQALIDNLRDTFKEIIGMPNNTKGLGGGASGNVGSVIAWQGWEICEARVKETETLFKRDEKLFLAHVLKIINDTEGINLKPSEVDVKPQRRITENLLVKAQSLQNLLASGIEPEAAITTVGLWNDPMDIAQRSKPYLKKWEYKETIDEPPKDGDAVA